MSIDHSTLTLDQLENMSDEDFANLDPSQFPSPEDETPRVEEHQGDLEVEQEVPTQPDEVPEAVETPGVTEVETPNEAAGEAEGTRDGEFQPKVTPEGEPAKEEPTPVELSTEKEFFEKVTAKFNANGREFKIDNPDDVVSLMQKGLNYNQKMAAMKPNLKIVKALQEHGIESVDQLGYLLDLHNKKPEAIAKLVQESGIDTYDLNEEKASTYVPSVPTVSDEVINFEMTAQALENNPHFGRVVEELRGFDAQAKEEVFKKPQLLNVLTEHVALGYYDQIVSRIQQEQAVGRLNGVPFLQAYDMVGGMMFGNNNAPAPQPTPQVTPAPVQVATPVPVPVASKTNTVNNTARQAAAGTTSTAASTQKLTLTREQLWNMSDEDFAKIDPKFL